jgi:Rod binding domain-containing protein
MNIVATGVEPRAADHSLDRLANDSQVPEREKIRELSRQFESVLLRHILENAQKTIVKSDLTPESAGSDLYQDLITSQLAEAISRSGSFGFAQSLERELTRQLTEKTAE